MKKENLETDVYFYGILFLICIFACLVWLYKVDTIEAKAIQKQEITVKDLARQVFYDSWRAGANKSMRIYVIRGVNSHSDFEHLIYKDLKQDSMRFEKILKNIK